MKNYKELAKRLAINGIEKYKQKFILEEDLMNGEERRKIVEEVDKIIKDLKEERTYKAKAEELQKKLDYIATLDDCDEEFEL